MCRLGKPVPRRILLVALHVKQYWSSPKAVKHRTMARVHEVEVCIRHILKVYFAMSLFGCRQSQSAASAGVVASFTLRFSRVDCGRAVQLTRLEHQGAWSNRARARALTRHRHALPSIADRSCVSFGQALAFAFILCMPTWCEDVFLSWSCHLHTFSAKCMSPFQLLLCLMLPDRRRESVCGVFVDVRIGGFLWRRVADTSSWLVRGSRQAQAAARSLDAISACEAKAAPESQRRSAGI